MKHKVVIFTENNARILVNPAELEAFNKKPNAYVDPDLRFVSGIAPEHWKQVKGDRSIRIEDAHHLKQLIGDSVDWAKEHDEFDQLFYKNLYEVLDVELVNIIKASNLLAKLLDLIDGVNPKEVKRQLEQRLIQKSTDPVAVKQNKVMREFIDNWEHGLIIPMNEDERILRDKHIKANGVINELKPKDKMPNARWLILIIVVITVLLGWRLLK